VSRGKANSSAIAITALTAIGATTVAAGQTPTSQPSSQSSAPASAPTSALSSEPGGFWLFPTRPEASGTIATDRPGYSDSYAVMARGFTNLEAGYTFTYDREGHTRSKNHTVGEFSLRTGLTDNFELRVKWGGYSLTDAVYRGESPYSGRRVTLEEHDDGGTDMSVGFKTQLLKQDGLVPNLSIIPAISLPTGTNSKSTNDVDPEVRLAWNYALTDKWQIYGVGVAAVVSDSDGRFFQSAASLATYYQFTKNLGGFVEYYGVYPAGRGVDCQHAIDFGPVILVNDNFQIDIRAGFGLNEQAPDFFCGIGFGWRF